MVWSIHLRIDPAFQNYWTKEFASPGPCRIELREGDPHLFAEDFEQPGLSAREVFARGVALIHVMNGAVRFLVPGAISADALAPVEWRPDGTARFSLLAGAAAIGLAGQLIGGPSSIPQKPAALMAMAMNNQAFADALRHFGNRTDWYEIWKCWECICYLISKTHGQTAKFIGIAPKELILFRRTVNTQRHSTFYTEHADDPKDRPVMKPPKSPMPIERAQAILTLAIGRLLENPAEWRQ